MANYPKKKTRTNAKGKEGPETLLAELELFEEWRAELPPELRALLLKRTPAKEILKKYEAHAAARLVAIALTDKDAGRALAAAKEINDRVSGKPTETKKIEHQMTQLSDEQLDALLMTELGDLEQEEADLEKDNKDLQ